MMNSTTGGNEYAWDGKGHGFETDQDLCFFFKHVLSVLLQNLRIHLLHAAFIAADFCLLLLLKFVIVLTLTSCIFLFSLFLA